MPHAEGDGSRITGVRSQEAVHGMPVVAVHAGVVVLGFDAVLTQACRRLLGALS